METETGSEFADWNGRDGWERYYPPFEGSELNPFDLGKTLKISQIHFSFEGKGCCYAKKRKEAGSHLLVSLPGWSWRRSLQPAGWDPDAIGAEDLSCGIDSIGQAEAY